jgi:hypothetical protein
MKVRFEAGAAGQQGFTEVMQLRVHRTVYSM